MKKTTIGWLTLLLCLIWTAGTASAHVTVYPKEATQGSYEKFTVRVPTEKDVPTVQVELKFQTEAVTISRFEPKPGWTYRIAKDTSGTVTGVTWTASGDGLQATEFGEFNMQGKVSDSASSITWKAYQTYKDGSVVEWTGAPDAKTPASVTTVKPKPAGAGTTDSHGNISQAPAQGAAAAAGETDRTPLYLSISALVLGAAALAVSLRKKSR